MKCSRCGNDRFYADQVCYHEVIVDEWGDFEKHNTQAYENGIYDAENPHGPFICTNCGAGYRRLEDGAEPMKDSEL